ncbi:MAG: efflux RND transporter periplasmic adaptor subunit [Candidatus Eisenbacteria bacterium]
MSETPNEVVARLEAEKAHLQAALDQSYAQLSEVTSRVLAMSEAATSLVETHDASSASVAVLDVAVRSVLARAGCVFLSHGGGEFELAAATGLDQEQQDTIAASLPDLAICNLAENEGRTFDVAEAEADEAFREWRAETLAADPGADVHPRLGLFVPLMLGERAVAVLVLGPRAGGTGYDESDRLFLEHVADDGALAIDRALLFAQNQDRLEDLDALLRVSRELASTLDLDHVLITAVNLTGAIVARQRAVLALYDGGKLKIRAVNDFNRVDPNTAEKLGLEKLLEWLSYRKPDALLARLSEVEANEAHEGRDVLLEYFKGEMRSCYALGLRDDQGPVGILLLEAYEENAFAAGSDREALGVLTGQLSVAIRNAELYRQLPMVSALAPLAERRRRRQRLDPARRRNLLIGGAIALLAVTVVPWPAAIGGDGQVLPASEIAVRVGVAGIVRSVETHAGEFVVAGQRLATLEPEGLAERLGALRAEADRNQARGASAGGAADADARRLAELDREGTLARLSSAETDQSRAQVVAPHSGYVLTPDLAALEGRRLATGDVFCQVSRIDTMRVEVGVSEADVARIQPGQAIRLKVLGYPDRQFRGRVTEVSWLGEPTHPGQPAVFKVMGWVANPGSALRSGMTGRARVDVPADTLLARWTRGVWRWLRMGFWM